MRIHLKYSKPVYTLTDEELESSGAVQNVDKERRQSFDTTFNELALRILKLCKMNHLVKGDHKT